MTQQCAYVCEFRSVRFDTAGHTTSPFWQADMGALHSEAPAVYKGARVTVTLQRQCICTVAGVMHCDWLHMHLLTATGGTSTSLFSGKSSCLLACLLAAYGYICIPILTCRTMLQNQV